MFKKLQIILVEAEAIAAVCLLPEAYRTASQLIIKIYYYLERRAVPTLATAYRL